ILASGVFSIVHIEVGTLKAKALERILSAS
ncbi:hypothetical protein LCGC14_2435690, partial [marine sediment metagenome]